MRIGRHRNLCRMVRMHSTLNHDGIGHTGGLAPLNIEKDMT
ncbi:hypothetical protein ACLHDD_05620 [Pantoea sp. NSTU24]